MGVVFVCIIAWRGEGGAKGKDGRSVRFWDCFGHGGAKGFGQLLHVGVSEDGPMVALDDMRDDVAFGGDAPENGGEFAFLRESKHFAGEDPASFRAMWDSRLSDTPLPPQYGQNPTRVNVPFFLSEYGGIGWNIHGSGWGYGNAPKDLEAFYERFKGLADALLDNRRMFGFCYTQLTDIEQEQNGVYTYDRQPKFDCARLHAILSRKAAYEEQPPLDTAMNASPSWDILVGANPDGDKSHPWRYTFVTPQDAWNQPGFDDSAWKTGTSGFGNKGNWENKTGTTWKTSDIWLRQTFTCDATAFAHAALIAHYDNATEIYVNGKQLWSGTGWNDAYAQFDITTPLREAIATGENTIAVHCHQDTGGQFIDIALLVSR